MNCNGLRAFVMNLCACVCVLEGVGTGVFLEFE
jgi:hypothetical protein